MLSNLATILFVIVSVALNSFSTALWAQDVVEIDKIIIQKPKANSSLNASANQVRTEESAQIGFDLAANLQHLSGVHLLQYGGLESTTAVSLRGSNSQHVQMIWDGVPLETASGQGIQLQNIPTSQIAAIEIYKLQTPASLAQSNSNGTIVITSKPIAPDWHLLWNAGMGSFATRNLAASASHGGKAHSFHLGFDFLSTAGNFTFFDNNGTPANAADDQTTTRLNNDNTTWQPHFKWEWSLHDKQSLTCKTDFFAIDKGVAGFANFQSQNARLKYYELLQSVLWQTKETFSQKSHWENQMYARWLRSQFSDPFGEIGLGKAQKNRNTTVIVGDKLKWQYVFSPTLQWQHAIHYSFERFTPKDELNTELAASTSQRHMLQLITGPKLTLFSYHVALTGKLHSILAFYDINNDDPSLNNSNSFASTRTETPLLASLNLKTLLGPDLTLQGTVTREVRLPQFTEMFGDQGYVLGNPELKSEEAIKYDVGMLWQKENLGPLTHVRVEASYFEEWANDLIEFEINNGTARATNIGTTKTRGLETFLYVQPKTWLTANAGYTLLWAKDKTQDRFLIGRPKHEVNLGLNVMKNDFSFANSWNWIDDKFLDSLNTQKIEHRLRWDAELSYRILKNNTLSFAIKNITSSQIEDALGFPLPQRSYFLNWRSQW